MGCTAAELAIGVPSRHNVTARPSGCMDLRLHTLRPRHIASLEIPQLQVNCAYNGLDDEACYRVQKCFDLQTQRGGG